MEAEKAFTKAPKTELAAELMQLIAERYNASAESATVTELPTLAAKD